MPSLQLLRIREMSRARAVIIRRAVKNKCGGGALRGQSEVQDLCEQMNRHCPGGREREREGAVRFGVRSHRIKTFLSDAVADSQGRTD